MITMWIALAVLGLVLGLAVVGIVMTEQQLKCDDEAWLEAMRGEWEDE